VQSAQVKGQKKHAALVSSQYTLFAAVNNAPTLFA
jgi:hypothetical protein